MISRGRWIIASSCIALIAVAACGESAPLGTASPAAATEQAGPSATVTPTPEPTTPSATPQTPSTSPVPAAVPPTPTPTTAPGPSATETAPAPQAIETAPPTPTTAPTATAVLQAPTVTPMPTAPSNGVAPIVEPVVMSQDGELTTVEVVKILRPSVVHIGTQRTAVAMPDDVPEGVGTGIVPEGVGTGIVLDDQGHILTNNHVVEGAQRIIVTLNNEQSFDATLVGRDPQTDTAIVRIDATDLVPARLGVSAALEVGETVIAIGHALGLEGGPTVSKGVVSALGRTLPPSGQSNISIVDLVQTDASINPGNSGGPLVNTRAEVVGINTAIIPQSQGIGFSINIDDAKVVAAQLIQQGFVTRGYMGIRPFTITPSLASRNDLPASRGIYLSAVIPDTPAQAANLQAGDLIVELAGEPINNTGELSKFLMLHLPGKTVEVTFFRGQVKMIAQITLGELP